MSCPTRLEITLGHIKTHEVVVETSEEAHRLWAALCNHAYLQGQPIGGAVMSRADLPPTWYAFPGENVRGTCSLELCNHEMRRVTKRG